ncbi:MAG: hypothetical protein K2W97_04465 [Chthoniobacterales bacterium]|nr:hypothetical protein [Chthoniobacterales bacterium]
MLAPIVGSIAVLRTNRSPRSVRPEASSSSPRWISLVLAVVGFFKLSSKEDGFFIHRIS